MAKFEKLNRVEAESIQGGYSTGYDIGKAIGNFKNQIEDSRVAKYEHIGSSGNGHTGGGGKF